MDFTHKDNVSNALDECPDFNKVTPFMYMGVFLQTPSYLFCMCVPAFFFFFFFLLERFTRHRQNVSSMSLSLASLGRSTCTIYAEEERKKSYFLKSEAET